MEFTYEAKLKRLNALKVALDKCLTLCGELEALESRAPAGEEGYMQDTFATLAEIHAFVDGESDAVAALVGQR